MAVLSLLAAGCGGGGSPGVANLATRTTAATTTTRQNSPLAFSHCMRSNGVMNYPDPTRGGALVKESLQQLGVSSSRFQAAQSACQPLLPNGGSGRSPAGVEQVRAQALRFAQCMRSHGVTNFPDPASDGRIPDPASAGIDQGSPKFEAGNQACRSYRPPYMPSNAAYNTYARTHG